MQIFFARPKYFLTSHIQLFILPFLEIHPSSLAMMPPNQPRAAYPPRVRIFHFFLPKIIFILLCLADTNRYFLWGAAAILFSYGILYPYGPSLVALFKVKFTHPIRVRWLTFLQHFFFPNDQQIAEDNKDQYWTEPLQEVRPTKYVGLSAEEDKA
jgi:hypothetical protein